MSDTAIQRGQARNQRLIDDHFVQSNVVSQTPINDYHNGKVPFAPHPGELIAELEEFLSHLPVLNPSGRYSGYELGMDVARSRVQAILDKHKTP